MWAGGVGVREGKRWALACLCDAFLSILYSWMSGVRLPKKARVTSAVSCVSV